MIRHRALLIPVLTLLTAAAAEAGSARPPSAKAGSWAIVLASPASRAEAKQVLANLGAGLAKWVKVAEGYPKIVDSATVPGFQPGSHAVLLGYCDAKADAAIARGYAQFVARSAYLKQVRTKVADACPRVPGGEKSKLGVPMKQLATASVPGDAGLRLEVMTGNEHRGDGCKTHDLAVQLRRGAELLDERAWEGDCTVGCTVPGGEGGCDALAPHLTMDLSRFGRPAFIIGIAREATHSEGYSNYQVIGLGCKDTLAVSAVFEPLSLFSISWPELFVDQQPLSKDPNARWRSLQWYYKDTGAAYEVSPGPSKPDRRLELTWSDDGCQVTLRGSEAP